MAGLAGYTVGMSIEPDIFMGFIDMTLELAPLLNRPLTIGNKIIANRLVLAPMTFLGHIAFRQLLTDCTTAS